MRLAVDAHTHIYPQFNWEKFVTNLSERIDNARCDAAALFLTERRDCAWFDTYAPSADSDRIVVQTKSKPCVIFPGFQSNTAERIEVHALATRVRPEDGWPILRAIESISENGGTVMLGWGAGKWSGHRGKIVEELLRSEWGSRIILCDSRLRMWGWPQPKFFTDHRTFLGSDPLPLTGEEGAPLSFGQVMECAEQDIEHISPTGLLKGHIANKIGARLDPLRFAMLQTRLRIQR